MIKIINARQISYLTFRSEQFRGFCIVRRQVTLLRELHRNCSREIAITSDPLGVRSSN
jgi:hypothetical protein